jgi:hypothetical protein
MSCRLDFVARFILALIHTKTVNLVDISLDLNGEAKPEPVQEWWLK